MGLDVFYEEPLPEDDPLHAALHEDLSYHVTLTPHSAWQGAWTWVRDSLGIWHNVLHMCCAANRLPTASNDGDYASHSIRLLRSRFSRGPEASYSARRITLS